MSKELFSQDLEPSCTRTWDGAHCDCTFDGDDCCYCGWPADEGGEA